MRKGFSLIEALVIAAIIAVLAGLMSPVLFMARVRNQSDFKAGVFVRYKDSDEKGVVTGVYGVNHPLTVTVRFTRVINGQVEQKSMDFMENELRVVGGAK